MRHASPVVGMSAHRLIWAMLALVCASASAQNADALGSPVEPEADTAEQREAPPRALARHVSVVVYEDREPAWRGSPLEGLHVFAGLTVMGGPMLALIQSGGFSGSNAFGTFLFAMRAGVLVDHHEIALEISPMTLFYPGSAFGPSLQLNGTYAHYVPLFESDQLSIYWPLRAGVGLFAVNTGNSVFFQARADLAGVAFDFSHVLIELHLPSFRYAVSTGGSGFSAGVSLHMFHWDFGGSLSYVF
jgi:hypothetical protein